MAELTVVIPTYNNPVGAKELVSDLHRLHDPDTFRIISIDQTKEGIKFDSDKPVHLHIKTYRNLGFSKAMNMGMKLSTTPYTLLANDDVRLLHPSWYETARACVNKDGVLAVNPFPATRTWDGVGNPVYYWEAEPEKYAFIKDKPYEDYTEEDYAKLKEYHTSTDGPGTTMFFTLIRTEALKIIGPLDESYWNNGEDYDWNRRVYLTCRNCGNRKYNHYKGRCGSLIESGSFQPYAILTCTHSLVHHQCCVTKQNMAKAKEGSAYDLVVKAKNIFNNKWGVEGEEAPDIYGKIGLEQPNGEWYKEIDL